MKTFTIDTENNIAAFATAEEAAATTTTPFDSFSSQKELLSLVGSWPAERLVEIWNGLPEVTAVKSFKTPKTAVGRIWERIQKLGGKAQQKPKGGEQAAKGASAKGKATKKEPAAKSAPKRQKGETSAREG